MPVGKWKVLVAGTPLCEAAERLIAHPSVEYVGSVDNREALALYFRSTVALTLYDPGIQVNTVAEPNKWGDCVVTGTPFIVNNGVITAKDFESMKACFVCEYGDPQSLKHLLESLGADPDKIRTAGEQIGSVPYLPWDDQMRAVLAKVE